MKTLIFIVIMVILHVIGKCIEQNKSAALTAKRKKPLNKDEEMEWLHERWKLAEHQRNTAFGDMFPRWYFDEVTERQLVRLENVGYDTKGLALTKGKASDLIGLHEPIDDESIEVLKFFKIPLKKMNQTKARHEVALIMSDKTKVDAWNKRSPSQDQKEYMKFFGIKPPKGITHGEAANIISNHKSDLIDNDEQKFEEWEAYEEILYDLSDPDFRESYDIKRANISLIKEAIGQLQSEGISYREIADNPDVLVDRLIEMQPDLICR